MSAPRPNLVRELSGLAAARMGVRVLGVLVGWVVARVIGPEALGQLSVPNLLFVLLPFVTLGFADGLAREMPLARRDDPPLEQRLLQSAWLLNLSLLGACALLILLAQPLLRAWISDPLLLWLGVGAGLANGALRVALIGLSGGRRIHELASLQVVQGLLRGVLVMCLLFLLPAAWRVYVLHLGMLLSLAGALCWAARQGVVQVPRLDRQAAGLLARSGPAMAFASFFLMMLVVGDRVVMSRRLEGEVLGFFEQGVLIRDGLLLLPGVLLTVLVPDHAARVGDASQRSALLRDVARQSGLVAVLTPLLLTVLLLQLPWLIHLLLPRFAPGLPVFQLAVLGMGPIFLSYIFVSLLIAQGRSWQVGLLAMVCLGLMLGLDLLNAPWTGAWLGTLIGLAGNPAGLDLALGAGLNALLAFWLFTLAVMGWGLWSWRLPAARVIPWLLPSLILTMASLLALAGGWLQQWRVDLNVVALLACVLLAWTYEHRSGQLGKLWRARHASKS